MNAHRGQGSGPGYLPARMVNEFVYYPLLFFLNEWKACFGK